MMDIYDYEEEVIGERAECQDRKYYLSAVFNSTGDNELVMDYRVDPRIFFKYDYDEVIDYAKSSETENYISDNLEIVQVIFKDDLYTAVIKTYWLRVVQKAWKRLLNRRREWVIRSKKNILSLVDRREPIYYPSARGFIYF